MDLECVCQVAQLPFDVYLKVIGESYWCIFKEPTID